MSSLRTAYRFTLAVSCRLAGAAPACCARMCAARRSAPSALGVSTSVASSGLGLGFRVGPGFEDVVEA